MKNDKASTQLKRERPDPLEGDRPWPLYVWIFVMLMVSWGTTYFAVNTGDGHIRGGDQRIIEAEGKKPVDSSKGSTAPQEITLEDRIASGKKVYTTICQACHQANGQGITGAFPPLASSPWVNGKPERIIKLILHGLQGELEILGSKYNGVMPPHKDQFDDQQIADVATFIRKSFGNNSEPVETDLVSKLRGQYKNKTDSWKVEELENE